jgi:O-antigen/teichoic acid export membrane protein
VFGLNVRTTADATCPTIVRPYWDKLKASPVGSRLARGVFWSLIGAVISRGLMLAAAVVVARLLGMEVYGELGMIQATVSMFGVFAGFGLGLTATKHVAQFRTSDPQRVGRLLGLSGMVAVITGGSMSIGLWIAAPWVAEHTINAPHLAGALRIGALILFATALNGAQTGALSGFEAFKVIAQINLTVGLISFPLLIGGAYWGGLTGAVWALAINVGINWLLNHIALRREVARIGIRLTFERCAEERAILWRFTLPAVFGGVLVGPVNWVCAALLVNEPDGYAEMGIWSAANQWFAFLLFIPSVLSNVILPVLSDQLGGGKTAQSTKTMILAMKINLMVVAPLALAGIAASQQIMTLYGGGFVDGWPTLIVVVLTAALLAVQVPAAQVIAASGRMWTGFLMNLGWALSFIGWTLLLIDRGSFGLASARGLAYGIHALWTFGFVIWLLRKEGLRETA